MRKTDNRSNGGRFEQELAEILASHGFWAHVMQQNRSGQPSDVIAVKGKFHTLIDGKVISDNNGFPFSRIEENQRSAMKMFQKKCGELCYFALKLPDESVWMIAMERIQLLENRGKKRLSDQDIRTQAWPLDRWLESSYVWGGVNV